MSGGVLDRVHLFRRLNAASTRIAVLSASSGFGKTTLVRSWVATLKASSTSVVWVPLTASVSDERDLWMRVGSGLVRFGVVDDPTMLELLERGHDPVETIATAIGVSRSRTVLVIDAYEHVLANGADAAISRLVAADPMLMVVLTTRGGSTFTTAAGRLGAGIDVLDETDLAFSLDETERVVEAAGASPGSNAAAAVQRDTGGYPLAVRAVVHGMRSGLGAGAKAADWRSAVAQVVLDQLPPAARSFVLETAVPPYFDAALASKLAPRHDVAGLLRALERAGLGRWIPYSPELTVFQYVDAVRDAVLAAAASIDLAAHQRACGLSALWLQHLGENDAALELAVAGQRFDLATAVTRQILLRDPQSYMSDSLDRHLAALPASVLGRFPVLALARGLSALTSVATRGAAGDWLQLATRRGNEGAAVSPGEDYFDHTVRFVALRLLGRFGEAAAEASRTLALDRPGVGAADGLAELRPMTLRHLAYTVLQAGAVDTAVEAMSRAVSATTQPWSRNQTLSYAAGILAVSGRRYDADRTQALIEPAGWAPGQEFTYVHALGRVGNSLSLLDDLNFEGALRVYDNCEAFLDTAEFWPFITWTLGMARLGLGEAASEAGRIEERLRARPSPPGIGANLGTTSLRGLVAIMWLAVGQPARAWAHLEADVVCPGQLAPAVLLHHLMTGDAPGAVKQLTTLQQQAGHTERSRAASLTLGAAAALRVGNEPLALNLLQRGASLHLAHGARAHLVWVPELDLAALRQLAKVSNDDQSSAYLHFDAPARIGPGSSVEPLTERERVVLEAMMRFPTRPEIAAALHVSTNTVKTQLQSIYRKLGVSTRVAAIERAVELDLLARR